MQISRLIRSKKGRYTNHFDQSLKPAQKITRVRDNQAGINGP